MNERTPEQSSGSIPLIPALILFGGLTLLLVALFTSQSSQRDEPVRAAEPTQIAAAVVEATSTTPPTEAVVQAVYEPEAIAKGQQIYQTLCFACHGFDARGISGLGKTLIGSEYILTTSDEDMLAFLNVGRAVSDPLNTTGVAMPAKGGNPNLTDDDMRAVIAYIRSLNEGVQQVAPTAVPQVSAPVGTPTPFIAPAVALGLISGEGSTTSSAPPQDIALNQFLTSGQVAYNWSCAGCHGVNGEGVANLGPALSDSLLVQDRDGIALLQFLTLAQPPTDPAVAYPHPYRGGYPPLSDEQILDVIAYIYSLGEAE